MSMTEAEQAAALAEVWSGTVVPLSQISTAVGLEAGQYDFVVKSLTPQIAKNGMYAILGEFEVVNPSGFPKFVRTLYIGTGKDNLARDPQTMLNCPSIKFLKRIAQANNLQVSDATLASLCTSLIGKTFGNHVEAGDDYIKDGVKKKGGSDFGQNVTPIGVVPATGPDRLRTLNGAGSAAPAAAAPTGAAAGATFHAE